MGGVARAAEDVCTVMEAAGRQTILIETVGVGQDEVDVIGLADVTRCWCWCRGWATRCRV